MFTTKHAQLLFRVASTQTIRNWAKEFKKYLSPGATPGSGTTRYFNPDDLQVLSLIARMSAEGRSFEDIHANLASGQRGEIPDLSPEEVEKLAAGEVERHLSSSLHESRELAQRLQIELDSLKSVVQPLHDDNIRLRAQVEEKDHRIAELNEQLRDAQERIARLAEQKGEAYVKGIMEALQRQGNFTKGQD